MKCPRCKYLNLSPFYGPCTPCRADLRIWAAWVGGATKRGDAEEYEPKMNVTPNAVALKE